MTQPKKKITPPEITDMVASRPYHGTWLGHRAVSLEWKHKSDCRPSSKRINAMIWESKDIEIRVIEGDGRTDDFIEHARKTMTKGSSLEEIANVVQQLSSEHFDAARILNSPVDKEKLAAGILTNAGFLENDFYGGTAWLRPADTDEFTIYIRGAAETQTIRHAGKQIDVDIPGDIDPDNPCEVGIVSDNDEGRSFAVADNLDEAIRIADEKLLPLPSIDETVECTASVLFGSMKP